MAQPPPGYPQTPQSYPVAPPPPRSGGMPGWVIAILLTLGGLVVLGGIMAVLAIYGVRKYIGNAKSAEARNSLGQIAKDSAEAYERESLAPLVAAGSATSVARRLCGSASASVPASAAQISGRKYQSTPSEWDIDKPLNRGFACLRFSMDQPQYYMYSYVSTGGSGAGETFTATANGDLNGNGVTSTFSITGRVGAADSVEIAPSLTEINPEE